MADPLEISTTTPKETKEEQSACLSPHKSSAEGKFGASVDDTQTAHDSSPHLQKEIDILTADACDLENLPFSSSKTRSGRLAAKGPKKRRVPLWVRVVEFVEDREILLTGFTRESVTVLELLQCRGFSSKLVDFWAELFIQGNASLRKIYFRDQSLLELWPHVRDQCIDEEKHVLRQQLNDSRKWANAEKNKNFLEIELLSAPAPSLKRLPIARHNKRWDMKQARRFMLERDVYIAWLRQPKNKNKEISLEAFAERSSLLSEDILDFWFHKYNTQPEKYPIIKHITFGTQSILLIWKITKQRRAARLQTTPTNSRGSKNRPVALSDYEEEDHSDPTDDSEDTDEENCGGKRKRYDFRSHVVSDGAKRQRSMLLKRQFEGKPQVEGELPGWRKSQIRSCKRIKTRRSKRSSDSDEDEMDETFPEDESQSEYEVEDDDDEEDDDDDEMEEEDEDFRPPKRSKKGTMRSEIEQNPKPIDPNPNPTPSSTPQIVIYPPQDSNGMSSGSFSSTALSGTTTVNALIPVDAEGVMAAFSQNSQNRPLQFHYDPKTRSIVQKKPSKDRTRPARVHPSPHQPTTTTIPVTFTQSPQFSVAPQTVQIQPHPQPQPQLTLPTPNKQSQVITFMYQNPTQPATQVFTPGSTPTYFPSPNSGIQLATSSQPQTHNSKAWDEKTKPPSLSAAMASSGLFQTVANQQAQPHSNQVYLVSDFNGAAATPTTLTVTPQVQTPEIQVPFSVQHANLSPQNANGYVQFPLVMNPSGAQPGASALHFAPQVQIMQNDSNGGSVLLLPQMSGVQSTTQRDLDLSRIKPPPLEGKREVIEL